MFSDSSFQLTLRVQELVTSCPFSFVEWLIDSILPAFTFYPSAVWPENIPDDTEEECYLPPRTSFTPFYDRFMFFYFYHDSASLFFCATDTSIDFVPPDDFDLAVSTPFYFSRIFLLSCLRLYNTPSSYPPRGIYE